MAQLVMQPFQWGGDQPKTAADLARQQKVIDALLAKTDKLPTDLWSGLNSVVAQGVGNVLQGREDTAMNAGRDKYAAAFDALGQNPTREQLMSVMGNDFGNDGQSAVVKALLAQNIDNSDPAHALDMKYKQAQIDALGNKVGQPLINAGNGQIYDPNDKTWIAQPNADPSIDKPVVAFGDDGRPDPVAQQSFLDALPDKQYADVVKKVANYELDPAKITTLRGDQRLQLIKDVSAYDPTFDGTQFGVRAATKKAYTIGQQGQTITSANTVIGHLSALADDVKALGNQDFTPFNMVANAGKKVTSDPALAKLMTNRQAVASELAKFFKGTGATDLTTTNEWLDRLDPNMGQAAMQGVIKDIIGNLMKSRLDEMGSQYQTAVGKPYDFAFLSPETADVLTKMGIDPNSLGAVKRTPGQASNAPNQPNVPNNAGVPVPGFDNTFIKALP